MDWALLKTVLPHSFVGGTVIAIATLAGWKAGQAGTWWPVRGLNWWVGRVVCPLLTVRSWRRRTAVIAVNNTSICAGMVALGAWGNAAWGGVVIVGFALGVALRLVTEQVSGGLPEDTPSPNRRFQAGVGFALNLLEPPAILLAAGLSLGQGAMSSVITPSEAWPLFLAVALPALIAAAAGEALWMGIYPPVKRGGTTDQARG